MSAELERRITASLGADIPASDLASLVEETEEAIALADETAAAERERAFDPALTPDPRQAHAAMEDATFAANRLRTLLPRLERRYDDLAAMERLQRWRGDYETLKAKRDALAAELRETYPRIVAQIVDLFTRIATNDAELSRLHQRRPAGAPTHLRNAELEARNLESFGRDAPSLVKEVTLPEWHQSTKLAWPPPRTSLGLLVTEIYSPAPHPGADWWKYNNGRESARNAEAKRVATFYADQVRTANAKG